MQIITVGIKFFNLFLGKRIITNKLMVLNRFSRDVLMISSLGAEVGA